MKYMGSKAKYAEEILDAIESGMRLCRNMREEFLTRALMV